MLFQKILNSPIHVLHALLPPPVVQKYNFRSRPHNRHLPERTSRLTDCNFMIRMLGPISSNTLTSITFHFILLNCICICIGMRYAISLLIPRLHDEAIA